MKNFEHLIVMRLAPFVTNVQLNRPAQRNALNGHLWQEIGAVFNFLSTDPDTRVVIISGNGKAFCAGLDLKDSQDILQTPTDASDDPARRARRFREKIVSYQAAFKAIEDCPKPVIAAIHGSCIGGGVDLITACDIRVACSETVFCIKEVDIGMAADTGSLNRLPKICGNESWVREIALTARRFDETEALQHDLISKVYDNRDDMIKGCEKLAISIASKSPVAIQGTKVILNYSRDHSVTDSLNFVANWNMSQLMTEDIPKAALAVFNKQPPPNFAKL
uniref:Delta(3,5)-Delta(2,4)-dienoyl-CoA isomerase, mitochondrial n=1 Tax=Panagrellus redivivus TaxID=6233 RepID=A0A7E4V4A4_PANRE